MVRKNIFLSSRLKIFTSYDSCRSIIFYRVLNADSEIGHKKFGNLVFSSNSREFNFSLKKLTFSDYTLYPGDDCPGHDIAYAQKTGVTSIEACVEYCKTISDCKAVTWVPGLSNKCHPKAKCPKRINFQQSWPGIVSAV